MKGPVEIKQLGLGDVAHFKALLNIFKAVFENEAPLAQDERLQKLLANPDFPAINLTPSQNNFKNLIRFIRLICQSYLNQKTRYNDKIHEAGATPPIWCA